MKRYLGGLILIICAAILLPIAPVAAQGSEICVPGPVCTKAQVGVFMEGITASCGNTGECQLADIMIVVSNIGNYVLGVVGAVVFLMYVIAGVMLIGVPGVDKRQKAKEILVGSTVGLFFVLFAYVGIFTLRSVLVSGNLSVGGGEGEYVICDDTNDGMTCGLNQKCSNGICLSQCLIDHKNEPGDTQWDCVDSTQQNYKECQPGKCPGEAKIQCCTVLVPTN